MEKSRGRSGGGVHDDRRAEGAAVVSSSDDPQLDRRAVTRALAMLALLATLGGCDAFYTVRGTVRSCADQRAIAGAAVTLSYPGESGGGETAADGSYSVVVNDPPGVNDAELEVSSPGYATARRTVHHSHEESQDVCLEPAP